MKRVVMLTVASIALAATAAAQDVSPAESREGTIEQLVVTALERSPELRAARTEITAAGGQVTQARLRPNPTLSASQMFMTGEQHLALFEVEWPLELYRRSGRVGVAQSEVKATTLAIDNRERMLAASVREQAGRLLAARRKVEIMKEALSAARRRRRDPEAGCEYRGRRGRSHRSGPRHRASRRRRGGD